MTIKELIKAKPEKLPEEELHKSKIRGRNRRVEYKYQRLSSGTYICDLGHH